MILFGGAAGWSRTNNVYHEGPDLQSGDAHALASTTAFYLARPEGLKPPTGRVEAGYSIQLSYGRIIYFTSLIWGSWIRTRCPEGADLQSGAVTNAAHPQVRLISC